MQHRLDPVEDRLVGVGDDELLPAAVALGGVDAEQPGELAIDRQASAGVPIAALGQDPVAGSHVLEHAVDHGREVHRKAAARRVVLGVAIPVVAQEASELLAAVCERVTNRRSLAHQVGVRRLRDHVEQVDGGAGEVGVRDPPRHRDADARGELGRSAPSGSGRRGRG